MSLPIRHAILLFALVVQIVLLIISRRQTEYWRKDAIACWETNVILSHRFRGTMPVGGAGGVNAETKEVPLDAHTYEQDGVLIIDSRKRGSKYYAVGGMGGPGWQSMSWKICKSAFDGQGDCK